MSELIRYRFRDPQMIYMMSEKVAGHFPTRPNILLGIYELMLNAVEHGNLAMDRTQKARLLQRGEFHHELTKRAEMEEYRSKYVEVEIIHRENATYLTIRDQGDGFNWQDHFDSIQHRRNIHGRGLMIANHCFDALMFNQSGNAVTCMIANEVELPGAISAA